MNEEIENEALKALPEGQINYLALLGHSVPEIARQTGKSVGSVRWQLLRRGLGSSGALVAKRRELFRYVREVALKVADENAKKELAEWLGATSDNRGNR